LPAGGSLLILEECDVGKRRRWGVPGQMHDRARAIALLHQARDILAERLTERLLEGRDAILEDALGLAYSSEIDAIQEQIGQRLNHVNLMLNNLPPLEEAPPSHPEDVVPLAPAPVLGYEPTEAPEPTVGPAPAALRTAPSVIYVGAHGETAPSPDLHDFIRFVFAGDLERAVIVLMPLLDVGVERARECAERFREQVRERPQLLHRAMELRQELAAGSINGALLLLWECFGLQGIESIAALQSLRTHLHIPAPAAPSN
jgi:hypothetical protein